MIGRDRPRLESAVPSNWLANALRPAPDSAVAENLRLGKSGWSDYVHLLWTSWVFLTPLFGPGYTLRWALLTLASYPLFLWLYSRTLLSSRHHAPRYAMGMVAMSLVLVPWYPSGISYFIFGCVMLRVCRNGRTWVYVVQLLALNAVFVTTTHLSGWPWQTLVWIPFMSLVIGLVVNVETLNKERDAQLQLSQEEVRRLAATAERERIGRDLHDLLGHTLSLITLKLELSRKLYDRGDARARLEIGEAEEVARQALAQVRSAVTGIRASDLAAELASARLLLECQQVHLEYLPPPAMPVDVERALALVLREAVTNIARHARATTAQVRFERDGNELAMQVRDDGRGGVHTEGNGLIGMRERIDALRGTLQVKALPQGGTCIAVRVPLPPEATAVAMAAAVPLDAVSKEGT
ncbi:sensor histidine kinase [Stenotrophomonas tumulicola]|uniref:Sensor histidine kinase n=1 Tax=Stenotrophomonas tumulicola TaxID=1685415 RepID=A0A7W3IKA5_9GAMM|nr:sensor histidine kinase [Stenotrophomonas tumulicola]MBA8683509.1 sensor histidine kinase [Stenotrophomonas tumulicola]